MSLLRLLASTGRVIVLAAGCSHVTAPGVSAIGVEARVVAGPRTGWRFRNWMENGAIVSAATAFVILTTTRRTLTANFTPLSE